MSFLSRFFGGYNKSETLDRVLKAIEDGNDTRNTIAEATGINKSKLGYVLDILEEMKLVKEYKDQPGKPFTYELC